MKTEQLLPKNIRQIGSPVGHTKVYIEDYVITFLNSLSTDKNTYVRGAILFGEKEMVGQVQNRLSWSGRRSIRKERKQIVSGRRDFLKRQSIVGGKWT